MSSNPNAEGEEEGKQSYSPKRARINEAEDDYDSWLRQVVDQTNVTQEGRIKWEEIGETVSEKVRASAGDDADEKVKGAGKAAVAKTNDEAEEETKATIAKLYENAKATLKAVDKARKAVEEAAAAEKKDNEEETKATIAKLYEDAKARLIAVEEARKWVVKAEEARKEVKALKDQRYKTSVACLVQRFPNVQLRIAATDNFNAYSSSNTAVTACEQAIHQENMEDDDMIKREWVECPSTFLLSEGKNIDVTNNSLKRKNDSRWIRDLLNDAIMLATIKTGIMFNTFIMTSMFSDCPDHVVVVDRGTNASVMFVADSIHFKGDLASNGYALGQVYDHFMAMESSTSFGVLSTFDKSWLCWLDDDPQGDF